MQTLKTAAVLVLITVVLFGAYNTMTTAPDPLPPEIGEMLVESGEFEISDGLPDSFDDIGIDDGQTAGPPAASMTLSDQNEPSEPSKEVSLAPVNRTFADIPAAPSSNKSSMTPSADLDNSFVMSDLPSATPGTTNRLPPVSGAASIQPDPNQSYPSTGEAFTLPDPADAIAMTNKLNEPAAPASKKTPAIDSSAASAGLANAIATADRQYQADRRKEALATLSLFYETPNLSKQQRDELLARLDPLAREVVYSSEHLLDKPHRVGPNETLMDIAKKYEVPWQLLANINGVSDPVTVLPGTDLKVVRGPFRADIDLNNQELTLFVGDLYAGRFPVAVGKDPAPIPGSYTIQEKQSAKTYYDMSGTPIPPGNPKNPYGTMWIDLGSGMSIHGSPETEKPTQLGCISVAGKFSRDIFGILSEGSSVTIR